MVFFDKGNSFVKRGELRETVDAFVSTAMLITHLMILKMTAHIGISTILLLMAGEPSHLLVSKA
ncbi:MAG: hypothetical protein CW691_02370 [Candidatus Bathyarchaeum sp.]|nr:MAG: hypothetical protein CW691_02370 [Candidatus Bathyarchaeum sp.]